MLDGGPSEVGVESTIVDLSRGAPVLLRPGGISLQALADCLGQPVRAADSQATREADAPRVPGALPSHYAPSVPLRLLSARALAALLQQRATALSAAQTPVIDGLPMGRIAVWRPEPPPEQPGLFWRCQPTEAALAARHLYDTLHQLDALGVDAILVEQPPVEPAWRAVQDRLQRAAAAG